MHSPQNDSPVSSLAKTKHIKQSRQRKLVQAKIGKPSPQQTETSLHEHGNEKWNARNKRLARSFFMTKWGKVILSPTALPQLDISWGLHSAKGAKLCNQSI